MPNKRSVKVQESLIKAFNSCGAGRGGHNIKYPKAVQYIQTMKVGDVVRVSKLAAQSMCVNGKLQGKKFSRRAYNGYALVKRVD